MIVYHMGGVSTYMIENCANYQVYLGTYLLIVGLAIEGAFCPDKGVPFDHSLSCCVHPSGCRVPGQITACALSVARWCCVWVRKSQQDRIKIKISDHQGSEMACYHVKGTFEEQYERQI